MEQVWCCYRFFWFEFEDKSLYLPFPPPLPPPFAVQKFTHCHGRFVLQRPESPECTNYLICRHETIIFSWVSSSSENVRQEICSIQGKNRVLAIQRKNFSLQANLLRGNAVKFHFKLLPGNLLNKIMRMIHCKKFVSLRITWARARRVRRGVVLWRVFMWPICL